MGGMATAVQQGNGDAAVPGGDALAQALRQGIIEPQGLQFAPLGIEAAIDFQHPQLGQGGRLDRQGKDVGPVLVADAQQIGKAPVDEQEHRGRGPLQQGVGGHRGAQPHLGDQAGGNRLAVGQAQHRAQGPHRRIARGSGRTGEHLAHVQDAIRGETHQIGEGATAIHPETPAGGWGARTHGRSRQIRSPRSVAGRRDRAAPD